MLVQVELNGSDFLLRFTRKITTYIKKLKSVSKNKLKITQTILKKVKY